jgi:glycosyltransferase involved in cell wall biosynthesis
MHKKRILIHSNHCKMFTGFGKHKKNLLKYLYNTGKYEIIEFSNGYPWSSDELQYTPWKSYGSLPDDPEHQKEIANDERKKSTAGYGGEMIDRAIYELKPDIYLGIEDIWGFNGFFEKPWWNKIHCIIHTTLDSLPILPDAVNAASKINNYFVWASFAEKALHKLGHTHVKTVHGTLDVNNFYKLPDDARSRLRKHFNLEKSFIIGFVFRNQLRKSVPNLLDGFKIFDEQNPSANAKLLLHTFWNEGWDIYRLLKEKDIPLNKVLTTYYCKNCQNYHVKPFQGQILKCDYCQHPNSCETTNIKSGVNEQQLNEIYNLMDVYCHPFTSGGQEIPIQEAKLTELITLVTNYSCGEDSCSSESGGFALDWAEYREPGTQFIKASTLPTSINEKLKMVYDMSFDEKVLLGKKSRNYVINKYSIEIVGKYFEDLFDSLPEVEFDYEKIDTTPNAYFEPDNSLKDKEWIESLYENVLKRKDSSGVIHWMQRLKTDLKRQDILTYFRKVALSEIQKAEFEKMLKILNEDKSVKKIAYIQPDGAEEVLIATSILPSIQKVYPDHKIYFFTKNENFDLINSHPNVYKTLSYFNKLDDPLYLEGKGNLNKYFDIVFAPYLSIRNNYFRNAQDILEYQTT